ncbi:Phosphate ABC transporter substrate-binding protein [Frankia canadensis]|uniref:Phosphate ABC transporter substrate-binding protein n=1 Tax=Frankia canadensis TaxID=1836972 RepID=A0A2I2KUG7_9ACTN|nr:substrate-binding domain-containing protein [Frankia canadensis]SNQ49298.1 Phosphate ABC transporter substrate-binding protein [Frankia canadensis]SOU56588.1 Phosphate ABC transporter substrate-binding protein [Frankia canadensis]
MDWWSAGNIIAVLTALLGLGASLAAVWYERRPRSRQIGYRVQMAIRVGGGTRGGRTQAIFGLFSHLPGISDATLVLLRIENYGAQSITEADYTNGGAYGLTADVADLTVRGVVVIPDPGQEHLLGHFGAPDAIRYTDNVIYLPRVPLNPGQYYKLLVLLDGGGVGSDMKVRGGIRDGSIVETESVSVDDKPRKFSRPARLITVMLTVCVVVLACIILVPNEQRPPLGCAKGELTVAGSTAFAPVVQAVARRYEKECTGARITVDARGSEAGLRDVASSPSPDGKNIIAISDGRVNEGASPRLWGQAVARSLFALVVNEKVPVTNLTSDQLRSIFTGQITNWSQIDPRYSAPVQVMSRTTDSGTRISFDRLFITPNLEPAAVSAGCARDTSADREYCALSSTDEMVQKVATFPGGIGYMDLRAAKRSSHLRPIAIDGHQPMINDAGYRFVAIEYAYTYGKPVPGSLVDSFLTYLNTGPGRSNVSTDDDQPCYTPDNIQRCRG